MKSEKKTENTEFIIKSLTAILKELATLKHLSDEEFVETGLYLILDKLRGLLLYIPHKALKPLLEKQVRRDFKGNNLLEVAQKYRLSFQAIYNIIRKKESE